MKVKDMPTAEIESRLSAALKLNRNQAGLKCLAYQDALAAREKKAKVPKNKANS